MKIVDCKWFKLCKPWRMRMKVLAHMLRHMRGLINLLSTSETEERRRVKWTRALSSPQKMLRNLVIPDEVLLRMETWLKKRRGDVEDKPLGVRFPRYVLLDTRAFMSVFFKFDLSNWHLCFSVKCPTLAQLERYHTADILVHDETELRHHACRRQNEIVLWGRNENMVN